MKNFKKRERIAGGTRDTPYFEEYGEDRCVVCGIAAKKIKTVEGYSSHKDERGTLITEWNTVTIQCPECRKTESYDTPHVESDGNFYSLSQPEG